MDQADTLSTQSPPDSCPLDLREHLTALHDDPTTCGEQRFKLSEGEDLAANQRSNEYPSSSRSRLQLSQRTNSEPTVASDISNTPLTTAQCSVAPLLHLASVVDHGETASKSPP